MSPTMATQRRIDKYSPLMTLVKEHGWQLLPLMIIIACQRGGIHKLNHPILHSNFRTPQSINQLQTTATGASPP